MNSAFANERSGNMSTKELAGLYQVAHMYYMQGIQQPEIAQQLFFSRAKVSRMLKKARELGIVEISVRRFVDRMPSLEKELLSRFNIKEAIVTTSITEESADALDAITTFAALIVSNLLKGHHIVGITRGRTIAKVVEKLKIPEGCSAQAVQLMGATALSYDSVESRDLANLISNKFSGTGHYLNAPLYIDDLHAREILLNDISIRSTFAMMKQCDIILTGIGSFEGNTNKPPCYGYMTDKHIWEMQGRAVGSICSHFYDIDGKRVNCEWNAKNIAMPFDAIRNAKLKIGVVVGEAKVRSVLGALRGKLLDVLITDADTAIAVIKLQSSLSAANRDAFSNTDR